MSLTGTPGGALDPDFKGVLLCEPVLSSHIRAAASPFVSSNKSSLLIIHAPIRLRRHISLLHCTTYTMSTEAYNQKLLNDLSTYYREDMESVNQSFKSAGPFARPSTLKGLNKKHHENSIKAVRMALGYWLPYRDTMTISELLSNTIESYTSYKTANLKGDPRPYGKVRTEIDEVLNGWRFEDDMLVID
jgi:hypothetical protein